MNENTTPRTWSTTEVVRHSGVTSRTLRHYDSVGLLTPSRVDESGLRHYGEDELVRLQQILVLRELGLGLDEIAAALDADDGNGGVTAELLREHQERLRAERARLTRLTASIDRTIDHLEGRIHMDPAALFDGFDPQVQARHEEELVDRYGEDVRERIDESWKQVGTMTKADADEVQRVFAEVDNGIAMAMADGATPSDPRVQALLASHYANVARFWEPDAEAYAGLGDLYVESPDFRARYEAVRPGLAEFLRDAMAVYALESLD
jgi:DNA-binding transcriptional MerR regulator